MKIVLTGSLGHIGKPLATGLAQRNHDVTVISSKPDKQKDIEDIGATAAIGSLENIDFLTSVFAGADAVFLMVPPNLTELDQLTYYKRIGNNYRQALRSSGVKHIVYLSSYGAHLDKGTGVIVGAHHVEKMLGELPDVAITYLRPGYFYYNLNSFVGMITGQSIIGSNYGGDDKLVLVAPADIAVVAGRILTSEASGTKVEYIVSDEHTCNETAGILGTAIGKPDMPWLTFTDEQTKAAMEQSGMPAPLAAIFVELGAAIHSGILLGDYEKNKPAETGKIKLEDFAKEFAESWQSGDEFHK